MKFKWNLQPEFERYKKDQRSYKQEEGSGEYVGSVRVGNLCFDIIDWGNHLWFDLYVGGVDTSYDATYKAIVKRYKEKYGESIEYGDY